VESSRSSRSGRALARGFRTEDEGELSNQLAPCLSKQSIATHSYMCCTGSRYLRLWYEVNEANKVVGTYLGSSKQLSREGTACLNACKRLIVRDLRPILAEILV